MRKKLPPSFFSTFVLLLLVSSCGDPDRKEIEELLSRREKAFETKNVELYLSCVSPNYREEKNGKVIGTEEIKKNFLSNVSIFDQISVSHSDRSIYREGDKAEVVQKTAVEARIEKDKSRFQVNEKLGFKKIGDRWEIVKESGADFLSGFVFGGKK